MRLTICVDVDDISGGVVTEVNGVDCTRPNDMCKPPESITSSLAWIQSGIDANMKLVKFQGKHRPYIFTKSEVATMNPAYAAMILAHLLDDKFIRGILSVVPNTETSRSVYVLKYNLSKELKGDMQDRSMSIPVNNPAMYSLFRETLREVLGELNLSYRSKI